MVDADHIWQKKYAGHCWKKNVEAGHYWHKTIGAGQCWQKNVNTSHYWHKTVDTGPIAVRVQNIANIFLLI